MRFLSCLAALLLPFAMSVGPVEAATVQKYQQTSFEAAQLHGDPILVFVEASWCPTCAKERPILSRLYAQPEFRNFQVFDVDFDTSKPLLRYLNVQMQSTLIVYHGTEETGRLTGATDPAVIEHLLETSGT
jgi:thioredoxin 1